MAAEGTELAAHPGEFGMQVRNLRIAAGLTQAELAERSGISERTVSDLERGLRATAYPSTARRLAAALEIGPEGLAAFVSQARGLGAVDGPSARSAAMPSQQRARLPSPLTRLLGREAELSMVLALIKDPGIRLVTLVGIGGIGKTRLAVEVAARAQGDFPGGSYFVELSATDDPEMVIPAIATAFGLPQGVDEVHRVLARILGTGRALLVLDTLEHLLEAAPSIGQLLGANPQLSVLATSRTPLHLRGEREVPVLPLPVRTAGHGSGLAPATELFTERATAVLPAFSATPTALEIVADICARVDGVPLAIELAAARVKHLSLSELRRQLDHRLEPLDGGARDLPERQRTMRNTHDWSYALLRPDEMRLFRSLGALRGGFGSEAAEAMLGPGEHGDPADVAGPLGVLVNSSLVFAGIGAGDHARYRLLDVTREYAVERSVAAGEFDAVRRRHANYFLARAEEAEPELRGGHQQEWQARLLEDEGNFRAALTWALENGEGDVALRLAGALWMFWRWAGLSTEGRAWLDAALAASSDHPLPVRCRALWGAGWLAFHTGAYRRTDELGQEMLRLLAGRDDDLDRRNALTLLGSAAVAEGRDDVAVAAYGEALSICSRLGTGWHLATSGLNLGTAKRQAGSLGEAAVILERAFAIYEQLGDRHFTARVLVQLGYIALLEGRTVDAGAQIERAMGIFAELGDPWALAEGLEAVATLRSESDPRSAARIAGTAERLRERIAMRPHPADARLNSSYLERARARLRGTEFDDAWTYGRQMTAEEGVDLALGTAGDGMPAVTP